MPFSFSFHFSLPSKKKSRVWGIWGFSFRYLFVAWSLYIIFSILSNHSVCGLFHCLALFLAMSVWNERRANLSGQLDLLPRHLLNAVLGFCFLLSQSRAIWSSRSRNSEMSVISKEIQSSEISYYHTSYSCEQFVLRHCLSPQCVCFLKHRNL